MTNRNEITIAPNAQPVPVAEFRNRISTLERMIRVDLAACVGAGERSRWAVTAAAVAVDLIRTDCKRATGADWTRRERAIDRACALVQQHRVK